MWRTSWWILRKERRPPPSELPTALKHHRRYCLWKNILSSKCRKQIMQDQHQSTPMSPKKWNLRCPLRSHWDKHWKSHYLKKLPRSNSEPKTWWDKWKNSKWAKTTLKIRLIFIVVMCQSQFSSKFWISCTLKLLILMPTLSRNAFLILVNKE